MQNASWLSLVKLVTLGLGTGSLHVVLIVNHYYLITIHEVVLAHFSPCPVVTSIVVLTDSVLHSLPGTFVLATTLSRLESWGCPGVGNCNFIVRSVVWGTGVLGL